MRRRSSARRPCRMPRVLGPSAMRSVSHFFNTRGAAAFYRGDPSHPSPKGPAMPDTTTPPPMGNTANTRALMPHAAGLAAKVVRGTRPDRLGDPTPCPEYDVRALIGHLFTWTGERARAAALKRPAGDRPAEERDVTAEPGWADRYATLVHATGAAWSEPAA